MGNNYAKGNPISNKLFLHNERKKHKNPLKQQNTQFTDSR